MESMTNLIDWFSGNGRYMNLVHCMGHDYLWITITVALDLSVACGYLLIAKHWWQNSHTLPDVPAKKALGNMRNIFLFCGICGYVFIPIKMIWPAWRLYDLFMLALVYFTWRYAWNAKELKVVYRELGRSASLANDLAKSREQVDRKSFFLNALSHDLRTPLNGLILNANLAELSLGSNDHAKLSEALANIKAGTSAAAELIDTLLDYARLDASGEEPETSTFCLVQLVGDIIARFRPHAAVKKLDLRLLHSAPERMNVTSDRRRLERIISNLLDNAIKFTSAGSIRVQIEASQTGGAAEIQVIDTGSGIDPIIQEQLFDEFFQVHNHERDRSKGFGLGLAIARRLARQLGGDITVDSAVGRGSRFTLVLPGTVSLDSIAAGRDVDGSAIERSGSLSVAGAAQPRDAVLAAGNGSGNGQVRR